MALTLTATIGADAEELAVTGSVPAEIGPAYRFRLGDEALLLDRFVPQLTWVGPLRVEVPGRRVPSRNRWIVRRAQDGSTATAHTAGESVLGALDAFTSGDDEIEPGPFPAGGPGGTPTLAEVLAQGNDTGGLGIVNTTTGTDAADVSATATVDDKATAGANASIVAQDGIGASATQNASLYTGAVDASALANTAAGASDSATVARSATVPTGPGTATADTTATSVDGDASAATTAQTAGTGDAVAYTYAFSDSGSASAATSANIASGSGLGDVSRTVQTDNGQALADTGALSLGSGTASAVNSAGAAGGSASIGPVADATSALIMVTGLPTSDPGVPGALYVLSGVLMVSP